MEDDQLRLRASASGASSKGVVRPPASAGRYQDLDTMAVLRDVLCSADKVPGEGGRQQARSSQQPRRHPKAEQSRPASPADANRFSAVAHTSITHQSAPTLPPSVPT